MTEFDLAKKTLTAGNSKYDYYSFGRGRPLVAIVIDDMGDARVKLVFFDACRDNPLARSFGRGGSRGMAAPVEATGTLISFATKHGNTAADGDSKHSPYTSALLAALENPGGVEIEQMLRKVQQGVKLATKGQQEPWRYGSLDGDFYFKAPDAPVDVAKVQQETVDKAVTDAMRRAGEQAAREKAELQQSLKAQQAATDRAVEEAIKRSAEQAAKERAELQQSMEKMLKEALARQTLENLATTIESDISRNVEISTARAQMSLSWEALMLGTTRPCGAATAMPTLWRRLTTISPAASSNDELNIGNSDRDLDKARTMKGRNVNLMPFFAA